MCSLVLDAFTDAVGQKIWKQTSESTDGASPCSLPAFPVVIERLHTLLSSFTRFSCLWLRFSWHWLYLMCNWVIITHGYSFISPQEASCVRMIVTLPFIGNQVVSPSQVLARIWFPSQIWLDFGGVDFSQFGLTVSSSYQHMGFGTCDQTPVLELILARHSSRVWIKSSNLACCV